MIHNYDDNDMWEFIAIYIYVFYNNFFFFQSLLFEHPCSDWFPLLNLVWALKNSGNDYGLYHLDVSHLVLPFQSPLNILKPVLFIVHIFYMMV